MLKYKVDASDLLHWARFLDEMPRRTKPAMARALNTYGEGVLRSVVDSIAERTDLPSGAIFNAINVKEASPDDLIWEMDASQVLPGAMDWERPWESRDTKQFENDLLLKVVTSGDHTVCDVCNQVAENSPYTQEEIREMQAKWANYEPPHPVEGIRTNLVHPNCRCITQPWSSLRRLPLAFDAPGQAPQQLFTMRQLGQRVADELKVALRVIR